MTLYGPDVVDEALGYLQTAWVENCCIVAASSLVLYDQASTLSREVEFMWGRKWSSVTLLFYFNRWTTFIWVVQNIPLEFLPLATLPSCVGYTDFSSVIMLLLYTIWAVFSGIRIYAISGRKWWLASVVCLLNMVPVGVNTYTEFETIWYEIVDLPVLGNMKICANGSTVTNAENIALTIGTRFCVIAADILLLVVTWIATYRAHRDSVRNNIKTPVVELLLKDGTLYFTLLLALNIMNIIGNISNVFSFTGPDFTTPISSIIITHFLLNLRQVTTEPPGDGFVTSHPSFIRSQNGNQPRSWSSRLSFNHSFIDNMGGYLDHSFGTSDLVPDAASLGGMADEEICEADGMDEEIGHIASDACPYTFGDVFVARGSDLSREQVEDLVRYGETLRIDCGGMAQMVE